MRYLFHLILILALLVVAAPDITQAADKFPTKPITLVIPVKAGGSHDLHARGITSIITDILGQPMIVKLLPGGAGMRGTGFVAKAKPDGYTILFSHNGWDQLVPQTRQLPFNSLKSFKSIARINHSVSTMITRSDKPWKNLKELVEYAKKNPGKINAGHSGVWGSSYTTYQLLMKATGIKLNLIPHKGGGPALRAVLSGQDDITFAQTPQARPHVKAGRIRVLAVMGDKRFTHDPDFKDFPSAGDFGWPKAGFKMERIFLAPAGTPPERLKVLRDAFAKLQTNKSYKRFMKSIGMPTQFVPGDEYDKRRAKQYAEFTELLKAVTQK